MDIFDEFEMKPLTDGLGFHRKKLQEESSKMSASLDDFDVDTVPPQSTSDIEGKNSIDRATEALDKLMSTLSNLDKKGVTFSETLPSSMTTEASSLGTDLKPAETKSRSIHPVVTSQPEVMIPPASPTISTLKREIEPTPGVIVPNKNKSYTLTEPEVDQPKVDSMLTQKGGIDSLVKKMKKTPVSIASALVDAIAVFGMSLLFLVGMLMITGSALDSIVYSFQESLAAKISIALLMTSVLLIYVTVSRTFIGATLGEWAFDCQVGTEEQINSPFYPVKIAIRSMVTIATGLVLLPILSLLFKRDMAGTLSGVYLYRKN